MVDILGSLDESIENNENIIDNLLLKLRLEYSQHFTNKNDIPVVPLSSFIDTTIGGDWGKESCEKNFTEKVLCIRGADIPEMASGKNGNPPVRYILKKNCDTKKLRDFEIIVEISGGSPTQSTGRCALITSDLISQYDCPVICTNFCRALRCKSKEYAAYVYSVFSNLYFEGVFFNYENGTTGIKNLDLQSILEREFIYMPTEPELNWFYNYTKHTYLQVAKLKNKNAKLQKLKQLYLRKFFG